MSVKGFGRKAKCIMTQFLKIRKQYADYSGRTMETGDHFKNGASLKSRMSKGNILPIAMKKLFLFLV
jgi:hypothetical protein